MNWSKAPLPALQEIIRAAEAYLGGQLGLAASADQRASTLASAFTLAGTGVIAGLITLAATSDAGRQLIPVYLGGLVSAVMFLVGALVCVRATMPVDFWLAGNEPKNWHDDIEGGQSLEKMLGDEANIYQGSIDKNFDVLTRNARAFKWGAQIGVAAPFAGFIVWGLIALGSLISFWHA